MFRDSALVPRPERTQIKFLRVLGFFLVFLLISFLSTVKLHAQSSPSQACCGNFLLGVNYPVPLPGNLAAGDLNGDGKLDVVNANNDSTVSILLGNGDGTLQPQYTVTAVPSGSAFLTEAVAIGDLNGDGHADLAVLCINDLNSSQITGTVNILLNDGTGHFGAPTVIPLNTTSGTEPAQILSAKFGADANLDLAVLDTASGNVSILRGHGDGTFASPVDYSTGSEPAGIAIGDLNGDGYLDLVVAGTSASNGDGVVSVLLGKPDGTFGTATGWTVTSQSICGFVTCLPPTTVAIGDFNGEGKPDLAVNDGAVGGIRVLLGNGDGTFQPELPGCHSVKLGARPKPFNADPRCRSRLAQRSRDAWFRLSRAVRSTAECQIQTTS
jgi:hypothetical protein